MNNSKILVNGKSEFIKAKNINELLLQKGITPTSKGIAVAINGIVVPKNYWESKDIITGDQVEIVKPFKGG